MLLKLSPGECVVNADGMLSYRRRTVRSPGLNAWQKNDRSACKYDVDHASLRAFGNYLKVKSSLQTLTWKGGPRKHTRLLVGSAVVEFGEGAMLGCRPRMP